MVAKSKTAVRLAKNQPTAPAPVNPDTPWPFPTPGYEKKVASKKPTTSSIIAKYAAKALEGVLQETIVITKSRNGKLRKAALENSHGVCEACGIDYSRVLGGLGRRVLQVHHRRQLALTDVPQVNSIEDLAVVCANCHQMIHADMDRAMPVEELRKRLSK